MARGFGTGVLWGAVVVGGGLVVLSQLAPPPANVGEAPVAATAPVVDQAAADKAAAEMAAADKAASDKAAADKAAADKAAADKAAADKAAADKAAADKAAADKAAADKAAAEKAAAEIATAHKLDTEKPAADPAAALPATPPEASSEVAQPSTTAELPPPPDAPAAQEDPPSLTGLDQALTVPKPEPDPAAAEGAPQRPEGPKDELLVPGQQAGQPEPSRLPQIAAVTDPELAPEPPAQGAAPAEEQPPEQSPASTLKDDQPTLPATKPLEDKVPTGLDKTVPGVKVGELPQVGDTPEVAVVAEPVDERPIAKYARSFDGADGKPLFVILLHDVGSAGVSREDLAKLPFPVSFVVDPLATDAREAAAIYRAAGQEVVTLANGIPEGATASDMEETFQTLGNILPESVAVIDQDVAGFQDSRAMAGLVLPIIKDEGRGLVTYDRGLNAADQIARREDVPSGVVFRVLDAEGESKITMRRYLDRAAFKAAQEGTVMVIGETRADTVAAILEWTVEGRASTVTLAPVTAVLGR